MLQLLHPLTPIQPGPPTPPRPTPTVVDGPYECTTYAKFSPRPDFVEIARVTPPPRTNVLAGWWVRLRVEQLLVQLPRQFAPPVLAWLDDEDEQEHVRHRLAVGEPYTLTVHGGDAEYLLTVKLRQAPVRPDLPVAKP
ncbi:hypothetical protein [Kitasatospora aureofaciens]|uniref:hypothetical protein n=1 Tax=Kitasatospora aureofaciens TaxID=1894 RepID=UPI0034025505